MLRKSEETSMLGRILSLTIFLVLTFLGLKWSFSPKKQALIEEVDEETRTSPSNYKKNKSFQRRPASTNSAGNLPNRASRDRQVNFIPPDDESSTSPDQNVRLQDEPRKYGVGSSRSTASTFTGKSSSSETSSSASDQAAPKSDSPSSASTSSFMGQPISRSVSGGMPETDDSPDEVLLPDSGGADPGPVDNSVPTLTTLTTKLYWQTTEFPGIHSFQSSGFGTPFHWAGIINFRGTNVTSSGLNMACDEMADGDLTAMSPAPLVLLPATDVSGVPASSTLDIELLPGDLDYGANFFTAFMRNENASPMTYRCETRQMVLRDFPYFDFAPMVRLPSNGTVPEITGGLTHLGFFEEEAEIYRGPAGSSGDTVDSQSLETGILPVFH